MSKALWSSVIENTRMEVKGKRASKGVASIVNQISKGEEQEACPSNVVEEHGSPPEPLLGN